MSTKLLAAKEYIGVLVTWNLLTGHQTADCQPSYVNGCMQHTYNFYRRGVGFLL